MEQKAMAEELRALQRKGAQKLFAELAKWRDGFVPELGQKVADNWFKGAIAHLDENGILATDGEPSSAVLDRYMQGDCWHAFGKFSNWLDAKRGNLPWQIFWDDFLAERPTARDIVLMIAVSNALGKAERLLTEKAATVASARSSTGGRRGPCHSDALALFQSSRGAAKSDSDAIDKVREALRKNHPTFRKIPTAKTVREWLKEAGLISPNARP